MMIPELKKFMDMVTLICVKAQGNRELEPSDEDPDREIITMDLSDLNALCSIASNALVCLDDMSQAHNHTVVKVASAREFMGRILDRHLLSEEE